MKLFQIDLMTKLFGSKDVIKLSDLKNSFAQDLAKIRSEVYSLVVADNYYPQNPVTVKTLYSIGGIALAVLGVVATSMTSRGGVIPIVSWILSGIIIVAFGMAMSRRTKKGVLAREHILGLKRYLSVAEKERLAFHNAPEKNPKHFDDLLPYAIVLGVESQWADQFKDIYTQEPSWYRGPTSGSHFAVAALASDMNSFSTTAGTTMASSASSGGSGFSGGSSGGGFGGGGGGSW